MASYPAGTVKCARCGRVVKGYWDRYLVPEEVLLYPVRHHASGERPFVPGGKVWCSGVADVAQPVNLTHPPPTPGLTRRG